MGSLDFVQWMKRALGIAARHRRIARADEVSVLRESKRLTGRFWRRKYVFLRRRTDDFWLDMPTGLRLKRASRDPLQLRIVKSKPPEIRAL